MPGTKPKNNTRQYSEKCQDSDFQTPSAVTAQKGDACAYKSAGQASGEETLGGPIHQAGRKAGWA